MDIIHGRENFPALQDMCERLFIAGNSEPSTSYEWTSALMANHLKPDDRVYILVFKQTDTPVGMLPLVARVERLFGQPMVTVSPLAERYNTHSDVLMNRKEIGFAKELMAALFKLPLKWDVFRMARLLEGHPLLTGLEECLSRCGKKHRVQFEQPSYYLPLPESMDAYLAQRSGKFRNFLRRAEKKLRTLGDIAITEVTDHQDFDSVYEHILHVERNSWKHAHGTAISAIARQSSFYRDMCAGAARAGRLHLTLLYLREEPIVYNMGYLHDNRYYYLKTSYHEQFREHGAATYSRAKLIESLINRGVEAFDFPGEPYEWEQQWARELRWHKSLAIYNDSLRARAFFLLSRLRGAIRQPSQAKVLQFCDARDLQPPSE